MFNKLKILSKMKIKNVKLMLLGLLAMGSMNAFGQSTQWAVSNGVRYQYDAQETGKTGTAASPFSATVYGLSTASTTATIPAKFSTTDENEITLNFVVTGFKASWTTAVTTGDAKQKSVDGKGITSLTIDATNMSALTNAFDDLTKLATLTVSDTKATGWTITTIAGLGLTTDVKKSLTTLDISGMKGIKTIAANDFKVVKNSDYDKLTSISLPAALTTINANAFEGTKVTSLSFPATTATIATAAFKGATDLAAVDLTGTAVTAIADNTFEGAKKLATVALKVPATGTASIGDAAFKGCEALTAVTGLDKVASIGASAFEGAKVLATCDLSTDAELLTIGASAFKGTALTAVTIPNKVTTIGGNAFEGCAALATVSVAAPGAGGIQLATLGTNLFKGDAALTSVDLTNSKPNTIDATTFSGCAKLAEVKVPNSLISLPAGVFAGTVLTGLDLTNTGITLLDDIFQGTKAKPYATLTGINLPKGLTAINDLGVKKGVFAYCTGLEEITLPGSLTFDVPDYAFYFCTSLTKVTYLPDSQNGESVQEILNKAFIGCTPFVYIETNADYRSNYSNLPLNATFGDSGNLSVTTVADAGTSGWFFGKFCPQVDAVISKEDLGDAKLYSVYIDQDIAYFQNLRVSGGNYHITAGQHVIVKSKAATTIKFELGWPFSTLMADDIETANNFTDVTVADFQANDLSIWNPYTPKYLYMLTNKAENGGFGFTYFKGSKMKKGVFFISTDATPASAGRLETVWLDEDGNVETAIQKINTGKAKDGAIYNLQGVRVNAAQKGIYIQNGKKYIK